MHDIRGILSTIKVAHRLPGRVRLYSKATAKLSKRTQELIAAAVQRSNRQLETIAATIDFRTGSILITYDSGEYCESTALDTLLKTLEKNLNRQLSQRDLSMLKAVIPYANARNEMET